MAFDKPPELQSPPLRGRTRFVLQLVLMLVFLGAIWLMFGRAGHGQGSTTPGAATPAQGQQPIGTAASPSTTASELPSAEQVSAAFLQVYFTWDSAESDQTYITRWARFVVPKAVAALDPTSPRLSLDNGNDSTAQSPVPAIPGGSAQIQGQNAQVQITWTIQIAPPSAEQVIWQTRQIQATVWLTQQGTTWLVANLSWQSSAS